MFIRAVCFTWLIIALRKVSCAIAVSFVYFSSLLKICVEYYERNKFELLSYNMFFFCYFALDGQDASSTEGIVFLQMCQLILISFLEEDHSMRNGR